MSVVYVVFDDDKQPLYAFDSKEHLDYFLNGENDYEVRELEVNDTQNKRVLPCWEIRFSEDGTLDELYLSRRINWITTPNSVDVLDENGQRLFVQAESRDLAVRRAKSYRLNGE